MQEAYGKGSDAEQNFIQNLALFFCAYLKVSWSLKVGVLLFGDFCVQNMRAPGSTRIRIDTDFVG